MQTMTSSQVWQRRTNKLIAMATIIIGLTMMISTIPQCIYIGLVFIMVSLGWLAWMRMKENHSELPPPNHPPHAAVSPVLFLVTSQNFTQRRCVPTPADPNDKPPSYDQILKLDGLPPDYFTILPGKPPRYEDIEGVDKSWTLTFHPDGDTMESLPTIHSYSRSSSSSGSICGRLNHGPLTPVTLEGTTVCLTPSGTTSDEGTKSSEPLKSRVDAIVEAGDHR